MTRITPKFQFCIILLLGLAFSAFSSDIDNAIPKDADKYTLISTEIKYYKNTYNKQSKLIASKIFLSNDARDKKGKLDSQILYYYDDNHKLIKSDSYVFGATPSIPLLKTIDTYSDSIDQSTTFDFYPSDTSLCITKKKDERGLLSEVNLKIIFLKDTIGTHTKYYYDDEGKQTHDIQSELNGKNPIFSNYKYYTKGDTLVCETLSDDPYYSYISKTLKNKDKEVEVVIQSLYNTSWSWSYKSKKHKIDASYDRGNKTLTETFFDNKNNPTKVIKSVYGLK